MSYLTFASIADYLNCSVDYLLGRTDNPNMTNETYINGENGIQAVVGGAIEHNTVTISPTDEMTKEISLLLSELTYRQKTDLMKQIYVTPRMRCVSRNIFGTFIAIGISSVSSLNNLNSIAVSEMLI